MLSWGYLFGAISFLLFFYSDNPFILFLSIIFITISFSIMNPIVTALPGDISPKGFLEKIAGTFTIFRSAGITIGIIISLIVQTKVTYLIALFVTIISYCFIFSVLKMDFAFIKDIIQRGKANE